VEMFNASAGADFLLAACSVLMLMPSKEVERTEIDQRQYECVITHCSLFVHWLFVCLINKSVITNVLTKPVTVLWKPVIYHNRIT